MIVAGSCIPITFRGIVSSKGRERRELSVKVIASALVRQLETGRSECIRGGRRSYLDPICNLKAGKCEQAAEGARRQALGASLKAAADIADL